MKFIIRTLAISLLLPLTAAHAAEKYMAVNLTDGSTMCWPISNNLSFSLDNSFLSVTNETDCRAYVINNVKNITYHESSISAIENSEIQNSFSIKGGILSGKLDGQLDVIGIDGKILTSISSATPGEQINLDLKRFNHDILLISVNNSIITKTFIRK